MNAAALSYASTLVAIENACAVAGFGNVSVVRQAVKCTPREARQYLSALSMAGRLSDLGGGQYAVRGA